MRFTMNIAGEPRKYPIREVKKIMNAAGSPVLMVFAKLIAWVLCCTTTALTSA